MFAAERGSGSNIKVNAKDFLFSRLIMVLSVTALAFKETYVDTGEILSIFGKNREVDFNANEGALECSLQDSFF